MNGCYRPVKTVVMTLAALPTREFCYSVLPGETIESNSIFRPVHAKLICTGMTRIDRCKQSRGPTTGQAEFLKDRSVELSNALSAGDRVRRPSHFHLNGEFSCES